MLFADIFALLMQVGRFVSLTSTRKPFLHGIYVPDVADLSVDPEELWKALVLCGVISHREGESLIVYHPFLAMRHADLERIGNDDMTVKVFWGLMGGFPDPLAVAEAVAERMERLLPELRADDFPQPHVIEQVIAVLGPLCDE